MSQMEAIQNGAWKVLVEGKRVASLLPNASFADAAKSVLGVSCRGSLEQRYDGSMVWSSEAGKVTFR
jgi:hypothetical protein